jgi:hypothetical protein
MMKIRSLGYDSETDELDLLIDVNRPVPAESVSIGVGIYVLRERESGRVMGAMIRGYSRFLKRLSANQPIPREQAEAAGLAHVLDAIVAWQREVDALSQDLAIRLGDWERQRELFETLIKTPS